MKKKIIPQLTKQTTADVTARYLLAMHRIISKAPESKIRTVKDFAATVDADYTYLSKITKKKNKLNVTVAMLIAICEVHGEDANWLLTGRGEMFGNVTMAQRIVNLETTAKETDRRVSFLESLNDKKR